MNRATRLALDEMHKAYATAVLTNVDHQALIVVSSMQQAFERRGIETYERIERSELGRLKYVEYFEPVDSIWVSRAILGGGSPIPTSFPTVERLNVEPFVFYKKLRRLSGNLWRVEVYCCWLAISHRHKKVLYFVANEPTVEDLSLFTVRE